MKVLLTGAAGQLGQALVASAPAEVDVIAVSRKQLDLADPAACRQAVLEHRPTWVLNAGAYTAVDQAESDPDLAKAVNAGAPEAFAQALATTGGRMLQLSTDYVFNGEQGRPYDPDQPVHPLGVYGTTKAAGEAAALSLPGARVLRTSWVYGPVGRNICLTMLRLHRQKADTGEPLEVVADQVGCPTATFTLAAACWRAIGADGSMARADDDTPRILHWSDAGAASWYDLAMAIGELGVDTGLLRSAAVVRPITTAEFPTRARRPSYSLLDCTSSRKALKLEPLHWRAALADVLTSIPRSVDA